MRTELLVVDAAAPQADRIAQAANVLRAGGLVAFPTETVYGLGANALDSAAVARIFAAKGRPAGNPIIVHVPNAAAARPLVSAWPAVAQSLAERFWPGPLSLVLPKSALVPDAVTAGGPTVALRVPAHPVALELLRACALPLAAPSANPSTALSPTTAQHVLDGLDGKIDMVVDAGPTSGGLESSVLDVTVAPPRLLRPGLVTPAMIEAIIGPIELGVAPTTSTLPARSPGLSERHYAPRAPLELAMPGRQRVEELGRTGLRVGWVTLRAESGPAGVLVERMPSDPEGYAANLYAALHRLDRAGAQRIVVDAPPASDAWLAVHDRLRRAASV